MCHILRHVLQVCHLSGNQLKSFETVTNLNSSSFIELLCFNRANIHNSRFMSTQRLFSTEEKIKCIENLKKFKMQQRKPSSKLKNAAVLIPLCCVRGDLSLLYTLRRRDLKIHKGQISFPGGKQDSKDASLEITALRETEEEIGIPQSAIDVWGHGNIVVGREFNVLPVVGFVDGDEVNNLNPNPSEVELVFTIPLKHFCNPLNCRYTQFRLEDGNGFVMPAYINFMPGKEQLKIWGITAVITHIFLSALIPQKYVHSLSLIKPIRSLV